MMCTQIDCTDPATVLVRSDGMNADGIMVLVMWSGWDRFTDTSSGFYCEPHAREMLARLPLLAPASPASSTAGDVFTHG